MIEEKYLPKDVSITQQDWDNTPESIRVLILSLIRRIEGLEAKLNQNSSNSNKPPSSDAPFNKPKPKTGAKKKKGKPGGRKGHKGYRQVLHNPTNVQEVHPQQCSCGCSRFKDQHPYYTHQHIELPPIQMEITHFILYQGKCSECGEINKGYAPKEFTAGYGPRFSALIVELAGIAGNSRDMVKSFCDSVLGVPISLGAIQKVIDRASNAITPHYETIKDTARSHDINHVDETSWKNGGDLHWLWVMANTMVVFFMIHANRSKEAFNQLIDMWNGILISDDYGLYRKWVGLRQTCLAHLIRTAKGLSERKNPELAACGKWARKELQRLCKMANAPPTRGEWNAFFARLCRLIAFYKDSESEAGKFVRRIEKEMDNLFVFLSENGVDPTNNYAERMLRFGVIWRKRSYGSNSDKGCRWVERILSVRHTCRLHKKSTFDIIADAMDCYFKEQKPDVSWLKAMPA
ncbi:MAG: IS66 family transposase [Desulfobacterales bacterium]|nr:IS66 family transposase [Desulfobacterales bacterium]MBS3759790.1 IS66 family transposase [Desulfobacterales bacterium]